jgi:hypothetical protein
MAGALAAPLGDAEPLEDAVGASVCPPQEIKPRVRAAAEAVIVQLIALERRNIRFF